MYLFFIFLTLWQEERNNLHIKSYISDQSQEAFALWVSVGSFTCYSYKICRVSIHYFTCATIPYFLNSDRKQCQKVCSQIITIDFWILQCSFAKRTDAFECYSEAPKLRGS